MKIWCYVLAGRGGGVNSLFSASAMTPPPQCLSLITVEDIRVSQSYFKMSNPLGAGAPELRVGLKTHQNHFNQVF